MTKAILVGLAIIAVSASPALAKKAKPKASAPAAAATSTTSPGPFMGAPVSAADRALYEKNQRDSGMKKK
ncbi:hypothetical protein LJR220_004633 [Bradyrhizobium sp. LjRoot220]|uniref:hypothetical protein n=1 Tax=Bradyrhizobium sp. LjRoot220 TaxID=3342284 RepID=UPI003ED130BC